MVWFGVKLYFQSPSDKCGPLCTVLQKDEYHIFIMSNGVSCTHGMGQNN